MREALRGGPLGLAQKIYCEKMEIEISRHHKTLHPWPLLEIMLQSKSLGYVDYALAGRLMGKCGRNEESLAALICHLSLSSRRGHLCVAIDDQEISPSPEEIWSIDENNEEEGVSVPVDAMERLSSLILEGAALVGSPLLIDVSSTSETPLYPLCRDSNRYYLQRYWMMESSVIETLYSLHDGWCSALDLDLSKIRSHLDTMINAGILLPEQAEGVYGACCYPLSFITGGPGTGKTHTAGLLLRVVWEGVSEEKKKSFSVALAAPTGKAAANLEASMRRALAGIPEFANVKGQTLHQLLGVGRGNIAGYEKDITADLVIVDESSMIDVQMMKRLLGAMKPGSHLVLLGDKHQLASIEAGSLFADLINHFRKDSAEVSCVTELNRCLRAELMEIIHLSQSIKTGDHGDVLKHFDGINQNEGVRFVEFGKDTTSLDLQKSLVKHVVPFYPSLNSLSDDPVKMLQEFTKFRLLTPMRQGALGVEALNEAIHQATNQRLGNDRLRIVPIMIVENDHSLEVFNGETGLLFKHIGEGTGHDYALFPSRDKSDEIRRIPFLLLPRYEMAYCMTVHKSQGSEFDHVLLVLSDGSQSFGREGLYTGVTRAKRRVEVWSRPEILAGMISRQALRRSGIVERLTSSITPFG